MATNGKAGAKVKGPKLPVIMTANDLLDGEVVFLSRDGWTFDPAKALVAADPDAAERLEREGSAAVRANRIVEPYLVEVAMDGDGFPAAIHVREAIRQAGPTIHSQYGKQADFPKAGGAAGPGAPRRA